MKRSDQGFTLVEMLLTSVILVVILGVLGAFLDSQSRMAVLTNAKANVQDKARYILAAATQDLQLAGSSRYVSSTNTVSTIAAFGTCVNSACLTGTNSGVKDSMSSRYITSLRDLTEACRQVQWTNTAAGVLQRSDVTCGTTADPKEFADGVLAFNIRYICSNGAVKDEPNCGGGLFTRSARVTVYAASDQTLQSSSAASFDVEGTTVTCPDRRACFGIQQEIEMPNMKDK